MTNHTHDHPSDDSDIRMRRRSRTVLLVLGAIAAFFLVAEHRAHVLSYLPWLFLLACPLMHLFMHHGGDHGHVEQHRDDKGEQE